MFLDHQLNLKVETNPTLRHFICGLSYSMFVVGARAHIWMNLEIQDLWTVSIFWAFFMLTMLIGAPNDFTDLLNNSKWLKALGKYSFGFYLFHFICKDIVVKYVMHRVFTNETDILLSVISLSLIVGALFFHLIEENSMRCAQFIIQRVNSFLT
jgi:peptidoglycan/LPS O-acetylase OafA/YrhL